MIDIIQLVLETLLLLMGLWFYFKFKHELPKYYETKGSNKAMMEDIDKITKTVEEIKSNISIKGQHKINLKNLETEAIIDYDKKISYWLLSLFRYNLFNYNLGNYSSIRKDLMGIIQQKKEIAFSESNLDLFIVDDEFTSVRDKLFSIANKYEKWVESVAGALYTMINNYAERYKYIAAIEEEAGPFIKGFNIALDEFKRKCTKDLNEMHAEYKVAYKEYKYILNKILTAIREQNG